MICNFERITGILEISGTACNRLECIYERSSRQSPNEGGHKIGHNEKEPLSRAPLTCWCEGGTWNPHGLLETGTAGDVGLVVTGC